MHQFGDVARLANAAEQHVDCNTECCAPSKDALEGPWDALPEIKQAAEQGKLQHCKRGVVLRVAHPTAHFGDRLALLMDDAAAQAVQSTLESWCGDMRVHSCHLRRRHTLSSHRRRIDRT